MAPAITSAAAPDARAGGDPLTVVNRDISDGTISSSDGLTLKLQYLLDRDRLPSRYRAGAEQVRPLKCGFPIMGDVQRHWNEFTDEQRSYATSIAARPIMQVSVVSTDGHFRLHFDTTGVEPVPLEDADANGVPDFIDRAERYLDSAWSHYHLKLGYLTPPSDGVAGGDSKYDVYFGAIAGYGVTFFGEPGPAPWNDFSSFIMIHRNFAGFTPNQDPEGTQVGALKVTCAHEYFHAVQLAYDGLDDLWLYESSSTWNEVELFPETKDNYQYLRFFYDDLDTFLTTNTGFHPYGAFVWPTYLADVYGDTLIRNVWKESISHDGISSFDAALAPWGMATADVFTDFALWNFFTADRTLAGYFPNGAEYPGASIDRVLPAVPFTNESPLVSPDGLGASYMASSLVGSSPGLLKVEFVGSPTVVWDMSAILRDSQGDYTIGSATMHRPDSGTFTLYDYTQWDTLFMSVQVVSQWNNNNDYSLSSSVLPFGDANGSGSANVADVTFLIAYLFAFGTEPLYDVRMGDANCSGSVNIVDITFLIRHIFAAGPAPCLQ